MIEQIKILCFLIIRIILNEALQIKQTLLNLCLATILILW